MRHFLAEFKLAIRTWAHRRGLALAALLSSYVPGRDAARTEPRSRSGRTDGRVARRV